MVDSARATVARPVDIVCYVDDDDPEQRGVCEELGVNHVFGPRIILTQCWNECLPLATGDIYMQANDDIIFRTKGWDAQVEAAFAACLDKILVVHGQDVEGYGHGEGFGPHPFVHRRWIETLGYFVPPYFSSDFGDAWINGLADAIGRRRYVPIRIEHMHFSPPYKKAPLDETYRERLERHARDNPEARWNELAPRRLVDADKLRAAMMGGALKKAVVTAVITAPPIVSARRSDSTRTCPRCGSASTGISNGVTRCNQCAHQF